MEKGFDLVIRGGTLVDAGNTVQADLGIRDGKIAVIGENLDGKEVIDADSLLVIPGAIDPHVHMEMDAGVAVSSDDFTSGTKAAAWGGTTTIIDFVEAAADQTLLEGLADRRAQADDRVAVDYALHMTLDRADAETLAEIPDTIAAGVSSFKIYTTYGLMLGEPDILSALAAVGKAGGLPIVHCENDAMVAFGRKVLLDSGATEPSAHPLSRPVAAESAAIERILAMAELAKSPIYIVHTSSGRGAETLARAQARGQAAYGETCPQYLVLTDEGYSLPDFEGAKFVCSPPLRKAEDNQKILHLLSTGALQTVGTDHCPFFFEGQKEVGRGDFTKIPGGMPGVEGRLALLYTYGVRAGWLDLNQWVSVSSTAAARLFGLYPRKGSLMPGADADVVLFDPAKKVTLSAGMLHENVDYSPYEGMELEGYPVMTILRGKPLVRDGEYVGGLDGVYLECGLPELIKIS